MAEETDLSPKRVQQLREYFRISGVDLECLGAYAEVAAHQVESFLDAVYSHLMSFGENSAKFPDAETVARWRRGERQYVLSLFQGTLGAERLQFAEAVGRMHDRIGVEPWQYGGCFSFYASELPRYVLESGVGRVAPHFTQAVVALQKMLSLDSSLAWSAYCSVREQRLVERNREIEAVNRFSVERINELLEAQASLEVRAQQSAILEEVTAANFDDIVTQDTFLKVLRAILRALNLEAGELWGVDEERRRLLLLAHYGIYPEEFASVSSLRFGEGFPGRAAVRGEPVVTQELGREPGFMRREIVDRGFRFFAAVPVKAGMKVVAVLCVASLRPHPWDDDQSRFLASLGRLLGRRTIERLMADSTGGGGVTRGARERGKAIAAFLVPTK